MPPEIRAARSQDAPAAADVWLRSRHGSYPAIPAPVHSDEEVGAWFADVVLPRFETWVALESESVVAVMVLDGADWLEQLYVDPQAAGRGIGSRLVELAKQRRPDGLQLWTFESNECARRFYERHGFRPVERTDGIGNEEHAPDLRYLWP